MPHHLAHDVNPACSNTVPNQAQHHTLQPGPASTSTKSRTAPQSKSKPTFASQKPSSAPRGQYYNCPKITALPPDPNLSLSPVEVHYPTSKINHAQRTGRPPNHQAFPCPPHLRHTTSPSLFTISGTRHPGWPRQGVGAARRFAFPFRSSLSRAGQSARREMPALHSRGRSPRSGSWLFVFVLANWPSLRLWSWAPVPAAPTHPRCSTSTPARFLFINFQKLFCKTGGYTPLSKTRFKKEGCHDLN